MTSAKFSSHSFDSVLLQRLRTEKLWTDIDLVVEGETYSGHRAILSASSEYFFNMFTGNMVESSLSSVPISGVSSGVFKILFDFIYGESEAAIVEKLMSEVCSVEDLLQAADMFRLESLKSIIISYLLNNLDDENMLAVYVLGWKYNVQKVCEKAAQKISMNFQKLFRMKEFHHMKIDQLEDLFFSPYLQSTETNICKAIWMWFNFDEKNREKHFDKVMSLFCYHTIEDAMFRVKAVDKLYEKRNKTRSYDEACGENPRCPMNCPKAANTVEELANVYGDRCFHLSQHTDLMNTFTCAYSLCRDHLPGYMKNIQMCERKDKNDEFDIGFEKVFFMTQLQQGDHHFQQFYQGTTHDADHLVIITANYNVSSGYQRHSTSLGIFSRLPRVRLIIEDMFIPNPRYIHQERKPCMIRYPLMLVIGGCEVDMDDAVRFACSLVCKCGDGGDCKTCYRGDVNSSESCRYINIWSPSSERK